MVDFWWGILSDYLCFCLNLWLHGHTLSHRRTEIRTGSFCSYPLCSSTVLLPKLERGYRKYHTPFLHVWVHGTSKQTESLLGKIIVSTKIQHRRLVCSTLYLTKHSNQFLRVVHITLSFTVGPLSLCISFLLLWKRLIRGRERPGWRNSFYSGRCLCGLLWKRCYPLTF